jgi:hypothetical protein
VLVSLCSTLVVACVFLAFALYRPNLCALLYKCNKYLVFLLCNLINQLNFVCKVWRDESNKTVMTMCNLGRGTTFASAPAIDMTTLNLAGSPTPRDVWACWYATALACVRTGKCDQPCAAAPSTDQVGGDYLVDVGGTLDAASSRVDGAVPTSASVYSIQDYDSQASVAIAALKVRCGVVCDDFEHSCVEARVHCVLGSTFFWCFFGCLL